MKQRVYLELADVQRVGDAAIAEARKNKWPVTIAIVDDGGHLLWLQRLDDAIAVSADIAAGKARTSAASGRESKVYEDQLGERVGFLSAPGLSCLLEGGVPILVDGRCVGAVGVSGVKASEDAQVASAGVAALNR